VVFHGTQQTGVHHASHSNTLHNVASILLSLCTQLLAMTRVTLQATVIGEQLLDEIQKQLTDLAGD